MLYTVNTDKGINVNGGYVLSIYQSDNDEIELDLSLYDLSGSRINAYIFRDNSLEFDEERYADIIAEQQEEEKKRELTWQEKTEAQIFYTAMMTDTLLEE